MKYNRDFKVRVHTLDLENVTAETAKLADGCGEHVREAVFRTLKAEKKPARCEISVILTSDDSIRELNKRYLEKDRPTDILCFPYSSNPPFKCEMYISAETSCAQAADYGHTPLEELKFLVVHGILHLLGYKDHTRRQRSLMAKKENEYLQKIEAYL